MSVMPPADLDASRTLGRAAVVAMLEGAASPVGAVIESNFRRSRAVDDLGLPGDVVEVFCRCTEAEATAARQPAGTAPGHFDGVRSPRSCGTPRCRQRRGRGGRHQSVPVDLDRARQRSAPRCARVPERGLGAHTVCHTPSSRWTPMVPPTSNPPSPLQRAMAVAGRQFGAISYQQALAAGLTEHQVRGPRRPWLVAPAIPRAVHGRRVAGDAAAGDHGRATSPQRRPAAWSRTSAPPRSTA